MASPGKAAASPAKEAAKSPLKSPEKAKEAIKPEKQTEQPGMEFKMDMVRPWTGCGEPGARQEGSARAPRPIIALPACGDAATAPTASAPALLLCSPTEAHLHP